MQIKKNITLIVAVAVPVFMILFIAGSIYIPGIFIKPKYDFLYFSCGDYYCRSQFKVENGRLVEQEVNYPDHYTGEQGEAELFLYDIEQNHSRKISLQESQQYTLDSSYRSPDEFKIVYGKKGGFLFFQESDYSARYIKGHNVSRKLNLILKGPNYYNFNFIGWVIE